MILNRVRNKDVNGKRGSRMKLIERIDQSAVQWFVYMEKMDGKRVNEIIFRSEGDAVKGVLYRRGLDK